MLDISADYDRRGHCVPSCLSVEKVNKKAGTTPLPLPAHTKCDRGERRSDREAEVEGRPEPKNIMTP